MGPYCMTPLPGRFQADNCPRSHLDQEIGEDPATSPICEYVCDGVCTDQGAAAGKICGDLRNRVSKCTYDKS
jgi:hypothetical protein